jgi:hypothetical protein
MVGDISCATRSNYLDVLERKPGAMAGSTPLEQWRADWALAGIVDRDLAEVGKRGTAGAAARGR